MNKLEDWDTRLLARCLEALAKLITRKSKSDVKEALNIISQLREEQEQYEEQFFDPTKDKKNKYRAIEVISLYHFAKAVEEVGEQLLKGSIDKAEYNLFRRRIKYSMTYAEYCTSLSQNMILKQLYQNIRKTLISLVKQQ